MASESKGAPAPAPAPAPAAGIDIAAITASFTGHGLYNRLSAAPSVDPSTREAAIVALLEAVKAEGTNLGLYEKVCAAAQVPMDDGFVAAAQAKAQADSLVLERQLNIATANQVRDNIRAALTAHGDFKYAAGDLQGAMKAYVRARDYSTAATQAESYLNIVRVSLEMAHWSHIDVYAGKLRACPAYATDEVLRAKTIVSRGLSQLGRREYFAAAVTLSETPPALGDSFTDFVTMASVAGYVTLAAATTFSRAELKTTLLGSRSWKKFQGAFPPARTIITALVHSEYATCFEQLNALASTLSADPWIGRHLGSLLAQARARAMLLYCGPYSLISLPTMAGAFAMSPDALTAEVGELIASGQLAFRIDSAAAQLVAKHTDKRSAAYAHASAVSESFVEQATGLVLKAHFDQHNFNVGPKVPPAAGTGLVGAGGVAGAAGGMLGGMVDMLTGGMVGM